MSVQGIIGVTGTATIEVAEVERLVVELQRARSLAARLEQIIAKDHELLWRTLDEPTSHADAERLGFEIATWLNEVAMVSLGGAS